MNLVQCNKCGWEHFEVDSDHVYKWYDEWLVLCQTKDDEWLSAYGILNKQPPSRDIYLKCFRCGNDYTDFKPSTSTLIGHTIQPILKRVDTL